MHKKFISIFLSCFILLIACTNIDAQTDSEDLSLDKLSLSEKDHLQTVKACSAEGAWLQVLGSGGPELTDKRASTSYLLWLEGKARVLIDAGTGSAINFEKVGAQFSDLDAILLSHLHVDHSADLPAYIKGSFFTKRKRQLLILGPQGNARMPDTKTYIKRLFKTNEGAYQYLGDYLPEPKNTAKYELQAQVYSKPLKRLDATLEYSAAEVIHGPIPALAWRIDVNGRSIVFSGDMANGDADFISLLNSADIFVAHNAIPETAPQAAKNLHMTPSQIGQFAKQAKVKQLLLSHRMTRTLGTESSTIKGVKQSYSGKLAFANDFDCIKL